MRLVLGLSIILLEKGNIFWVNTSNSKHIDNNDHDFIVSYIGLIEVGDIEDERKIKI